MSIQFSPPHPASGALHQAALRCDLDGVRAAVEAGADVNMTVDVQDADSMMASVPIVYFAASADTEFHGMYTATVSLREGQVSPAKQLEVLEYLLDSGADANAVARGSAPYGREWRSCLVASFPSVALAKALLRRGASVASVEGWREDCTNETPAIAIAEKYPEILRLLQDWIAGNKG